MLESWHRWKMQKPGITLSLLVLCLQLSATGTSCCHPGATEQQKLGMEVAWELPALPQPVPPWAKQQGWLGMWGNDVGE